MPTYSQLTDQAPAKINLTLRVAGRRPDGYHDLHSLVVFADQGDVLSLQPDMPLGLDIHGPQAGELDTLPDNLVLRAGQYFRAAFPQSRTGRFSLAKNLPVAAGIGGGSSDAAAALRLLARLNGVTAYDPLLYKLAEQLGSDVPVCLSPRAQWMTGRGEHLAPLHSFPALFVVLINPRIALSTTDVFGAWANMSAESPSQPLGFDTHADLFSYLGSHPNDLEAPACSLIPVISDLITAMGKTAGCKLARMSGSGATVFGLFEKESDADRAAAMLQYLWPDFWIIAARVKLIAQKTHQRNQYIDLSHQTP
jgi:4-diphosphocytidyl-2-C-methyl-D-erythritol kinase